MYVVRVLPSSVKLYAPLRKQTSILANRYYAADLSQADAEAACVAEGAHVTSIHNAEENA